MLLRILLLSLLLPASALADAAQEEPACRLESPLSQAAAELLLAARPPKARELSDALRAAGSDLISVRALFLPLSEDERMQQWVAEQKAAADGEPVCGYARGSDARLLLLGVRAGSLSPLDPHSTRVAGTLAGRWKRPELVVIDGYGELSRVAINRRALRQGIPIAEELARPARIQLLAHGPHGPRPIAERVLPANPGDELAELADEDGEQAGSRARLSSLRRGRGLPALRDNRLLAAVAQKHAARVCREGRIAHQLEAGGDPEARLRGAGIEARRVGEVVSRAEVAGAAFSALARSPSHLLTLLQRGFTDVGVGEAQDESKHTCLVILLAEWPRYVGARASL